MRAIALVEDNADNRLLVRALIGDAYELREYETGIQALAAFERDLPDLVLLDISMPGMGGVEVLSRIRGDARLAHLQVVALTAHADGAERAALDALEFDGVVTKPIIDETILLRAVAAGLSRARR